MASDKREEPVVRGLTDGFPAQVIGYGEIREPLIVKFTIFKGRHRVTIRFFYEEPSGVLNPGRRGVEVPIHHLDELIEALKEVRSQVEDAEVVEPIPF